MKAKILIFLFFAINFLAISQTKSTRPLKCKNCEGEIKKAFFQRYFSEIEIIENNNKEYFGEDLDIYLPRKNEEANIFNLKFDALGATYPDIFYDKEIRKYFEKRKGLKSVKSNKYLYRNTFFKLPLEKKELILKAVTESTKKSLFTSKETEASLITVAKKSLPLSVQLNFTREWNKLILMDQIERLNEKLSLNIENLVFIVHGYNVPYSLAQIQSNSIIDKTYELDSLKAKKTLFVRVFWPSTSRKKVIIKNDSFIVKNKVNLYSISAFRSISTRSYLVGHSMRTIINGISKFNGSVYFFSHSLGAQVTASTFIIPELKVIQDTLLHKYLNSNPIVNNNFKKVKLFLNAPAMPGISSFPDSSLANLKNTQWVIGYNPTDKVLRKTIGFIRFGDHNGNTRLGGNWENETWEFKDYLQKVKKENQFKFVQTGSQYDLFGHDFFCYLNQDGFKLAFKDFMKN